MVGAINRIFGVIEVENALFRARKGSTEHPKTE